MRKGKRIIALMVAAALLSTIPFGIFTADEPSSFDMSESDTNMPEQDTDIYEQYKYIDISDNLQDNRSICIIERMVLGFYGRYCC